MKKIVVAMSGGIDSSITALLLKKQGYEIIGVTMAVWDDRYVKDKQHIDRKVFKEGCYSPFEDEDIASAESICRHLGIKHYVIDLREEYNDIVLNYFRNKYISGLTPNPCIICNKELKFSLIPQRIKQIGVSYDYYATGHYVILEKIQDQYFIKKARDRTKDQSYFLCRLQQEQLSNLKFPLGYYCKKEIKGIAIKEGLVDLVTKKESQDFIDTADYPKIFQEDKYQPGSIVDKKGNKIGTHKGLIYYTIGKRRGLNISGLSEPYYVTAIDAQNNLIYAGPKSELYHHKLIACDVIWSDDIIRHGEFRSSAKIRLHHNQDNCSVVHIGGNDYKVMFDEPQMAITPGQIIAFYDEDIVLGGGFIKGSYD